MKVQLTRISGNKKTGPIPGSMMGRESCPDSCALRNNGCYADNGPVRLHWDKVSERGMEYPAFMREIRRLPVGQLWRHNQAGDLPHNGGNIERAFLRNLVQANKGKRGFTYTHHRLTLENLAAIRQANENGFTVNVSANSPKQAARLFKVSGLPIVTVMGMDAPKVQVVDGVKIVACPAERSDKLSCSNCAICAKAVRSFVVGFRAHGTNKRKAEAVVFNNGLK